MLFILFDMHKLVQARYIVESMIMHCCIHNVVAQRYYYCYMKSCSQLTLTLLCYMIAVTTHNNVTLQQYRIQTRRHRRVTETLH
jgi:hypothetical protein